MSLNRLLYRAYIGSLSVNHNVTLGRGLCLLHDAPHPAPNTECTRHCAFQVHIRR